jgi:hypothetical protein
LVLTHGLAISRQQSGGGTVGKHCVIALLATQRNRAIDHKLFRTGLLRRLLRCPGHFGSASIERTLGDSSRLDEIDGAILNNCR